MSTITTLNIPDSGVTSRVTINGNFTNLNTDKQEKGSAVTGNIPTFGASNVLTDSGKVLPTGVVVGTTDTQTLANKTLTSPTINTAAINSPTITSGVTANGGALLGTIDTQVVTNKDMTSGSNTFPGFTILPTGSMTMYGGISVPSGWLLCDGSAVSRATYSALFTVLGSSYGAGDGSTTFNVPDMRGRVPVGGGTAGTGGGASGSGLPTGGVALTARSRGDWLGEQTHVLTTAELASHVHSLPATVNSTSAGQGGSVGPSTGTTSTTNTGTTGSDTAHNNIQPVMTVYFIIKQ